MLYKEIIKKTLFRLKAYKLTSLKDQGYIIAYHRVVDNPSPFYPELGINVFEAQIRHLVKNYNIVPVDEIARRITTGKSLRRCVALTFDDGFKDNYTQAYPILKKYNAPATVFLISGCIESGNAPWFMKFRRAFENTTKKDLKITLDHQSFELDLSTPQHRLIASDKIMAFFQSCANKDRLKYFEKILEALGPNDFTCLENIMLNWDEIREMSKNGICFGAHTHTHPVMSSLNLKVATKEVQKSKKIIEDNLGQTVTGFAYPVGKENHIKIDLISFFKKLGFVYSVTTSKAAINHGSDPFLLSRPSPWDYCMISKRSRQTTE